MTTTQKIDDAYGECRELAGKLREHAYGGDFDSVDEARVLKAARLVEKASLLLLAAYEHSGESE